MPLLITVRPIIQTQVHSFRLHSHSQSVRTIMAYTMTSLSDDDDIIIRWRWHHRQTM